MQQIEIEKLRPAPLAAILQPEHRSDVYDTHCTLDTRARYQLVAPSGKGKSTLLHILFGLRRDYDGTVRFDERDIRRFSPAHWARLRRDQLGMVFQDLRLLPQLTASENVRAKWVLDKDMPESALLQWAEALDVAELWHQPAATLSYGQQQRVAILRALSGKFRFLLLDEPFSHLDPELTRRAQELIEKRCDQLEAGLLVTSLTTHPAFEDCLILEA